MVGLIMIYPYNITSQSHCIRHIAVVGYSNIQQTIYRTCLSTVCFRTLESLFDVSLYTTCSENYFCSSCFTIVSLKVCINVVPHSAQSVTQAKILTRTSANLNNYKSV